MTEKRWAELDDAWRRKEVTAMAQRSANDEAARACLPMPFPNPWDCLDPTKLPRDASAEKIAERQRRFREKCPPFRPKRHTI